MLFGKAIVGVMCWDSYCDNKSFSTMDYIVAEDLSCNVDGCGGRTDGGCWCDDQCTTYNDCCVDAVDWCDL